MGCNNSKNKIQDSEILKKLQFRNLEDKDKSQRELGILKPLNGNRIFTSKIKILESLIQEFEDWINSYSEPNFLISTDLIVKFDMNTYITIKSFEIRIEKKLDLFRHLNTSKYEDIKLNYDLLRLKLKTFLKDKLIFGSIEICPNVYTSFIQYITI